MEKDFRMLAKTFEGLEKVLAKELLELGAKNVQEQRRAVSFEGDMELMYRANLWLRTAINILKPISSFKAESEQELYDGIYSIKWFEYFDVGKSFSIDTVLVNSNITHSMFATYKVKDAIADQYRYYFNQRPDVGRNDADININVYISGNQCEVSLNSSGVPLFKRGYRQSGHRAPINEVLAAGLIKLSGWDMNSNFIDPMCGSGTLLVEAALMAYNFPPAFLRETFSFMNWSNYDPTIWRKINEETNNKQKDFEYRIIGGDISEKNLKVAEEIIKEIKFHKDIELVLRDVKNHHAPEGDIKGWVVTNPPYGERLKSKDLEGLYSSIGDAFKNNFVGYKAWMISSDIDALKSVGLKTSLKIPIFNGPLECRFNAYDLYEGTKRVDVEVKDQEEIVIEGVENSNVKEEIAKEDIDNSNTVESIEEESTITVENELLIDLYVSNKVKDSDDRGERREERGRGERREERGRGERKEERGRGERRGYDNDRGERRSYGGGRREDGGRGERREERGRGERRGYDNDRGERRSYGGGRREDGGRGERKEERGRGERRSYDNDRGERRSYGGGRREDRGRGERRGYDNDRGERKSYGGGRREDGGRGERREERGRGERRGYDNNKGERRGYDNDRGERKSYGGGRREGDGERRPYRDSKRDDRGERRDGDGERRPYRDSRREDSSESRSYDKDIERVEKKKFNSKDKRISKNKEFLSKDKVKRKRIKKPKDSSDNK